MTAKAKFICSAAAVILIVAIGLAFLHLGSSQTPPVRFGCVGVSTSSNTTTVSVGISNYSGSTIVYWVCPPTVKSNGHWADTQLPANKQMEILAGGIGTTVVTMPLQREEVRVPILWGFYWGTRPDGTIDFARRPPIQAPTTRGVEMQSLGRHADGLMTGRDPNGMGALYTNYLEGIRP